jgi:hypothetical protein
MRKTVTTTAKPPAFRVGEVICDTDWPWVYGRIVARGYIGKPTWTGYRVVRERDGAEFFILASDARRYRQGVAD